MICPHLWRSWWAEVSRKLETVFRAIFAVFFFFAIGDNNVDEILFRFAGNDDK